MKTVKRIYQRLGATFLFVLITLSGSNAEITSNVDQNLMEKGEYIFSISGCASCHTDSKNKGKPLAGGVPLDTPFGVFFAPNITADKTTGIGGWSDDDFIKALTEGVSPEGENYFPAFPYTSYVNLKRDEIVALKAYIDNLPTVENKVSDHDVMFPFNNRAGVTLWKELYFDEEPIRPNPNKSELWNRGNYLVNGPSHCVECHTSRDILGGLEEGERLKGIVKSLEGEKIPTLERNIDSAFSKWTKEDIVFGLQTGMMPSGDFLGGSMEKVIENTTGKMVEKDLEAIAVYLMDWEEGD